MMSYFVSVFKWALILLGGQVVTTGASQIWAAVHEARARGASVEASWLLGLCQVAAGICLAVRYFLRLIDPVWRLTGMKVEEAPSGDSELREKIVAHGNNLLVAGFPKGVKLSGSRSGYEVSVRSEELDYHPS